MVAITTLFGIAFVLWINKNNVTRYKTAKDFRKKENQFYKIATFVSVCLIDAICLYLYFEGLESFGKEILVTLLYLGIFTLKTFVMLFVFIWVRWTIPRFRYDQIQRLGWEKLMPLAILNIIITAVVVIYGN